MSNDVMGAVKLPAFAVEEIGLRLAQLSSASARVPELAYATGAGRWDGCGCKGSCMGGCTSW